MWGVKNTTLSILWNGGALPYFVPERGLRQGDPLSPYLFVFCMEQLALRISELHLSGIWNPLSLSQGGLQLTHLFFADDVMLFCQASVNQVELVNIVLKEFSEASGLTINLDKSKFVVSKKVDRLQVEELEAILGICHTTRIKKYLGTPMIVGSPKIADFHGVVDKINARLASWK
uniref:Reverse transcriptase domain-containing protein n=1 Tax=Cajanus cajan TaxID=3821 RepID=A0A151TJK4_CAJCA|nr:hypothetical protein KK1_013547 [Cajanus cajan]